MYSEEAAERRRCTATRADGEPCQAWALWADVHQRCVRHARGGRGPDQRLERRIAAIQGVRPPSDPATRAVPCTCTAYPWPHRPGGGYCRWPELPLVELAYPPGDRHRTPRHRRRTR